MFVPSGSSPSTGWVLEGPQPSFYLLSAQAADTKQLRQCLTFDSLTYFITVDAPCTQYGVELHTIGWAAAAPGKVCSAVDMHLMVNGSTNSYILAASAEEAGQLNTQYAYADYGSLGAWSYP